MSSSSKRPEPSAHWLRSQRSGHRARSHAEAHEDEHSVAEDIPQHDLIPAGKASLITTDQGLGELVAEFRRVGVFAYDSEFIGELTYVPKLCLIQVATAQLVALIDPLAPIDLRPFWELVADPGVEKIVHAGVQDIEPVCRALNRPAANIFDTQVAAGMAGMPYPLSLSKLIHELVGYKLGKGLTFTHWDQRPLSVSQLRYAADDVRYLPAARFELGRRLEALGHMPFVRDECSNLCDPSLQRFDPDSQFLRIRGANGLALQNLAVLRELTRWRDQVAQKVDAPPRGFLRDEVLFDIARSGVKSVEKLGNIRGLPRPVESQYGQEIIEAIHRGLKVPAGELPEQRQIEESTRERFRTDSLWAAVQAICVGKQIDAALVTSRQEIAEFLRRTTAGAELDDLRLMKGWRRTVAGQPIVELMAGKRHCTLRWENNGLKISDC